MVKIHKHAYFLLLLAAFVQINGKPDNVSKEEYSKRPPLTKLDASFIEAVKYNKVAEVQELIKKGANTETPISYISTEGDCDWNIESTAMMYAIRNNLLDMAKLLITVEKNLNLMLQLAIKEGHLEIVEELIKSGADINAVDKDNNTPLIIAIDHAKATAKFYRKQYTYSSRWQERQLIIKALLTSGANVTHINKDGETALMVAVKRQDLSTLKDILQISKMTAGSFFGLGKKPINYADKDGNTALILAVKGIHYLYSNDQEYNICKNSQEIVNELLKTPGIDAYHTNKEGDTAIKLLEKVNKEIEKRL